MKRLDTDIRPSCDPLADDACTDSTPCSACRPDHDPRFCVAGLVTGLWLALLILGGTAALAYLARS